MAKIILIKNKLTEQTKKMDINKTAVRTVFPSATQNVFLRKDKFTKRFITGYELTKSKEEIKEKDPEYSKLKERQYLEEIFNSNFDNPDDEFLINYKIPLCGYNNQEIILNLDKPEDRFKYNALVSGGYVAPNKKALNDVNFLNCNFYFEEPNAEVNSRKELSKIKNKIGAKLAVQEDNKPYLLAVVFKLGLESSPEQSKDILYNLIDDYKEKLTSLVDAEKTLKVLELSPIELEKNLIIQLAIKYFALRKNQQGEYVEEGVSLGKTLDEYRSNLLDEEFAPTYQSIRKKIYKQFKLHE